jgi:hypothetical protein
MSDAWVAIIAAASGIIGAAISGAITYKITSRQVQARLDELRQQLQHDREEARRGRLIEARKTYLVPLRTEISNVYGACITFMSNTFLIGILKEGGLPTDARGPLKQVMEQVDAAAHTFTSFPKVINPLIEQIADPNLHELISSYNNKLGGLSTQITLLYRTLEASEPKSDGIEKLMNDIAESVNTILPETLAVNQRIENLLSCD